MTNLATDAPTVTPIPRPRRRRTAAPPPETPDAITLAEAETPEAENLAPEAKTWGPRVAILRMPGKLNQIVWKHNRTRLRAPDAAADPAPVPALPVPESPAQKPRRMTVLEGKKADMRRVSDSAGALRKHREVLFPRQHREDQRTRDAKTAPPAAVVQGLYAQLKAAREADGKETSVREVATQLGVARGVMTMILKPGVKPDAYASARATLGEGLAAMLREYGVGDATVERAASAPESAQQVVDGLIRTMEREKARSLKVAKP